MNIYFNSNIITEDVIKKQIIINTMIDNIKEYILSDLEMKVVTFYNIDDIAEIIKTEFDIMYEPTWHCIVGRGLGSYVTH